MLNSFFNEAERYKMHEFQNVYKMNLCYKVSHSLKLEGGHGRRLWFGCGVEGELVQPAGPT